MASLISQNIAPKFLVGKSKRKGNDDDEYPLSEVKENTTDILVDDDDLNNANGRKRNKKLVTEEEEKDMKKLENFLFGSLHSPVKFGDNEDEEEEDVVIKVDNHDSAVFFVDKSANDSLSVYEEDTNFAIVGEEGTKERKPVWVDDEEEKTSINIAKVNRLRKLRKDEGETVISGSTYVSRLRAHHMKLNPGTEWARHDSQGKGYNSSDESDSDNENASSYKDILRTNEDLVINNGAKLLPGRLEYSRLYDANKEEPSNGPIHSVQFHQNSQLLLVGGLDKRLRFFQIDGKRNPKIQSIFLDDCPIRKASFLPDGSQVIVSGRRKFFYSFDLVKATVDKIGPLTGREEKSLEFFEVSPDSKTIAFIGNEGYILLVSSKTKELIGTLKMNGTARSISYASNGHHLLSSGGDGHIYHWDLRTMSCFHKGVDEGCINSTSLCTSPDGNMFAAGSDSGIVNVYNQDDFLGGKRKPLKRIENLTTRVNFMKFNQNAEILAICSSMKQNSLKLVHIPSFTVFSNWPPVNKKLSYPSCVDFSPHGGFMAMGNAQGKVLLYKLHHYHHA